MKTSEEVKRVVDWINQAESQALQVEGTYADGGGAAQLHWMKNTLLSAPHKELQQDLLKH